MVCVPPEFSLRNPEITDGSLEVVSPGGKFLNTAHFSIRLENRDRVARQRYNDRTVRFRPHADPIRVSSSAGRMVKVLSSWWATKECKSMVTRSRPVFTESGF